MTPAQIAELLTFCAAFDRRTIGRADALAWHQVLGDLDHADARRAVAEYYAEHREWIMPADIRQRVKAIRAARITAAHALYDGQPQETGSESAQGIRQLTAAAAAGQLPAQPIRAALETGDGTPSPRLLAHLAAAAQQLPTDAAEQPTIGVTGLAVACEHCFAPIGSRCKSRRRRHLPNVHPGRLDAARAAAARVTAGTAP